MRQGRRHNIRQEFWRELNKQIRARSDTPLEPTEQKDNNDNYRPIRGISPLASYGFNVRFDNQMMVYLYILESRREEFFQFLQQNRDEIRAELGEPLEWRPPNQRPKIVSRRTADVVYNRNDWGEYQDWLIGTAEQFHSVFHPYLEDFQEHHQ
jgi:hypothetical protein